MFVGQHREPRIADRAVLKKRRQTAANARQDVAKTIGRGPAGRLGGQLPRTARQVTPQRFRRDEPPIDQRRQAGSEPPLSELREHERDVVVLLRDAAADSERLGQRLADEPWHLRVGGEVEPGVDVGFEREFAQEGQAERVDGRDGDVAETLLQLPPSCAIDLRGSARFAEALDDPLAHFGRSLAGKRDREDVLRLDARAQQVDVALDQHAGLAGSRRRLEDDVPRRIDRVPARRLVSSRHSLSCIPQRSCTFRTGRRRRETAGTRRGQWRRAPTTGAPGPCSSRPRAAPAW